MNGIDLLGLSRGTHLLLGGEAVLEITGRRNPCRQIDDLAPGLMRAVLEKGPDGSLVRKAGVMAVVVVGGEVRVGDSIQLGSLPALYHPLESV
jgi:MOSC domain-containing protein YiiM